MKELFHFSSPDYLYADWLDTIPKSCSGLLMPNANLASLHGGFGDMLFQGNLRRLFDLWLGDYDILNGFTGFSSLDYSCFELATLIKNNIYYNQSPFGGRDHKRYEINLTHSLSMDNKVRFEKDVHYSTFDLHFKLEVFEMLMSLIPDLVSPFLNEYYAGRHISLFDSVTYPNEQILVQMASMIRMVTNKGYLPLMLDLRGVLLLANVFLWNAEIKQRRGLNDSQLEISFGINQVLAELTFAEEAFKGIDYYAKMAGVSSTYFKNHFQHQTGVTPYQFYQNGKMENALFLLGATDVPIKTIAKQAGYAKLQGFYKAFKKNLGKPPTDFLGN